MELGSELLTVVSGKQEENDCDFEVFVARYFTIVPRACLSVD